MFFHFQQFENKIFQITYDVILNKEIINTKYKNKINEIQY